MDPDSWRLKILWLWPQLPKKKIKLFIRLGDQHREKGNEFLAEYCYKKCMELAKSIQAVHCLKKIAERYNETSS